MSDAENPVDLPDDHPLGSYNGVLDDHESHLEAIAEFLADSDPEEIQSLMLVLTTDEPATETIPTMQADAEFENVVWTQLAAHISHLASAFGADPEDVARHGCHVLRQHQGGADVYGGEDGAD